ncbi:enoyl-CoA hydratase/isomerase family protein (plasmid) [Prescottella equi]|uniref:enoyl-CoA hydratase/isomerase family protein n=1 Tax=Rhodococcus hoagii TaxID=43767 RepID=UPI002578F098|nr:enoyl-CoA hydratase/isomerase family protein [Prescottella equi]WJJ14631.1 enoyl-CoA hydratase/isomerase family protein [Prescottella equi]
MSRYDSYERLVFDTPHEGILRVTINNPTRANALDAQGHNEITKVWRDIDADPSVRAVIVTGAGQHFSAGGDLAWVQTFVDDADSRDAGHTEARELVYNLINFSKPLVSAIKGVAVGAGLVVALLADVSIAANDARLLDGHTKLGVAAGDHATLVWPLLCGIAKAKYYLLTGEPMSGAEAERIGLVSHAVDSANVEEEALRVARVLGDGAPQAISWTKQSLNSWYLSASTLFDAAVGLEFLGFGGKEGREGVAAAREKRPAVFR